MTADDLAAIFAQHGQAATWTRASGAVAVSGTVVFDDPDETLFGDGVLVGGPVMLLATDTFPELSAGDLVATGGETFSVAEVRRQDDGAIKLVRLARF